MRLIYALAVTLLAGTTALGAVVVAQSDRAKPVQVAAEAFPPTGIGYRLVGPFRGGRATGVSGVASKPNVYYAGFASSGLWKTTDAGVTWNPLWDKFPEASPSVGAIAVAPSAPNIIYVGTGEANIRGNVVAGNGLYKSVDAGKTWQFLGLRDSQVIGRIAVNATDPNTAFVAALGHTFGDSTERGIYRTQDGGKTWKRVLYVDAKTGGIDVKYDPANPNVLYAAMWQVYRRPWTLENGGTGSGLYRSVDGGTTWTKLTGHGLPGGVIGRIGVAPTSNPDRVYAIIAANEGGLYRTDDGGANWKLVNDRSDLWQRDWYYNTVFADPKDPNKVFVLNTGAYKSTDGGATFNQMPTFHGDNHELWINPRNTDLMVNSNDGGADVSIDAGETWTPELNQPTAQFYHVAVDNRLPYHIYGAQQDYGTVEIASANLRGGIGQESWRSVGPSESGYVLPDPTNPDIVITSGSGGMISRFDGKTGQTTVISPSVQQVEGWAPKDRKHRAQWTTPIAFSPHAPHALYVGNEVLFKSTDLGQSWAIISPDLTRNDKSKQQASGGPLRKDQSGIEVYDTIFSVVESPVQQNLIWVGTDDGLIQLTKDGGAHWQNVTPKDMPEWCTVDMVEADPHKAGTAYIAVDCHRLDDLRPHAFRTDDFGKSWVSITEGIPEDAYVHVVRADPDRSGLLYAGTERGIFASFDDGAHWSPLQLNLPRVPVHDLVVHAGDLVVATHGRAFWVLDDISPIRQWSAKLAQESIHLFTPRPTIRLQYVRSGDIHGGPTAANPPEGVIVNYFLKNGSAPKSSDKIEFLDADDRIIKTFTAARAKAGANEPNLARFGATAPHVTTNAGMNRLTWNMHYEGAPPIPNTVMWWASLDGPVALPGKYKVRLTINGKSQTEPFEIIRDPRLSATPAELKQQFDLSIAVLKQLQMVQNAIVEIRDLQSQLASIRSAAKDTKVANQEEALQAVDRLEQKSIAVEDKLIQRKIKRGQDTLAFPVGLNNQLASLNAAVNAGQTGPIMAAHGAPTQAQFDALNELKAKATAALHEWRVLESSDLVPFNKTMKQEKLPTITLKAETTSEGPAH